jgi:hypothetical protein
MNKARGIAYRTLLSGSRYHAGKISGLTLGQRRGSLKSLRDDFRQLCNRIKRQEKSKRIEYFGTYVRDFKDDEWRRHAHIVWTSPITDWQWLKETYEKIAKEQSSIYIDNRIEESRYKLGYCLQYNANQKGESIRYAQSKGWLPQGYHEAWKAIKGNKDSNYSAWILDMNAWIDLQRAIKQDTSVQTELMHIECDINDAALQVPGTDMTRAHAFVKRAI